MSGNTEMNMMTRELSAMERDLEKSNLKTCGRKNIFENRWSYYETNISINSGRTAYLSMFKPGPGKAMYTQNLPDDMGLVFPKLQDISAEDFTDDLLEFAKALAEEKFAFKNSLFLLPKYTKVMDAETILRFYQSLFYESSKIVDGVCVAVIRSLIDETFKKTVYLTDDSVPQEALDTFIVVKDKQGRTFTILGYKRKSETMKLRFSNGEEVELLEVGLYGNVICGEHLEDFEKVSINNSFVKFQKNKQDTGFDFLKLDQKQVSASMRALLEELGFVPNGQFTPFMVGKHDEDGRDPRYWPFGKDGKFGYPRKSESTMVVFVGDCESPPILSEPLDTDECTKGTVVEAEYALREFRSGGKLDCAFVSHPKMLSYVNSLLPQLFAAVSSKDATETAQ